MKGQMEERENVGNMGLPRKPESLYETVQDTDSEGTTVKMETFRRRWKRDTPRTGSKSEDEIQKRLGGRCQRYKQGDSTVDVG